jgi:hypothetical protein
MVVCTFLRTSLYRQCQISQGKSLAYYERRRGVLLDWLIEDKDGKLISVPSVSPENTLLLIRDTAQISVNTTGDIALIKLLALRRSSGDIED